MVSSSINCKHIITKLLFCVGLFFINEAYAGDDLMCSYASFAQQRMDQVTASVSDTDLKELNSLVLEIDDNNSVPRMFYLIAKSKNKQSAELCQLSTMGDPGRFYLWRTLNNLTASHVNGTCGYSYNEEKTTIAYELIENNVNNGVYWPGIIEYAKFNERLDTPDNILYAEVFYYNFEGVIDLPALRMLIDVFVKSNNIKYALKFYNALVAVSDDKQDIEAAASYFKVQNGSSCEEVSIFYQWLANLEDAHE